jgi:hypothetical protein
MAGHKIHEHTKKCPAWKAKHKKPWPYFKSGKPRKHYPDSAAENEDYLVCKVCQQHGWVFCYKRLKQHLRDVHGLSTEQYQEDYPGAEVRLKKTLQRRQETVRAKYGVDNVSKLPEVKKKIKDTWRENYGTDNINHVPEVLAKREATLRRKYGEGVRNAFQAEEVKAKIRATMVERHGAENPQQVAEIRERTQQTNQERYGADHYFETEEFQEVRKKTCLGRYGVDHHMKSEEGRRRQREVLMERYGTDNPLKVPHIWRKSYETNLQNHGGKHSQQSPEVLAKARATWLEKYGVDNPSKSQEVLDRIRETWIGKYGVPFPPQSLWSNRSVSFPNKLEQQVDDLSPECVVYTGDASYWVRAKGQRRSRNPDFVVLTREQVKLYQEGADINDLRTSAVIEVFGDYWHGPEKTGKSRSAHKDEVTSYYGRCGIVCLVLWEHEIKKHPRKSAERIQRFLRGWRKRNLTPDKGPSVFDLFGE